MTEDLLSKIKNRLSILNENNAIGIDVCDQLLQIIDINGMNIEDEKYDLVIKKLQNIIHDPKIMNDNLAPYEKAKMLQYKYGYTPQYSEIFFKTLQENGYNMRAEIQDAMFILGNLPNPNHNKEEIKKLINSKVIEDISFNGKNIFTIVSKEYGKLEFELASYFFRENEKMMSYMDITKLPCHCHNHAYYMSKIFPDLYSITSICQADFLNTYYYHTYTYGREENHIIDLCYNSIIEKNQYYNIFEPWEISVIKNSEVEDEIEITNTKTKQDRDRYDLLKIALYKQYLQLIDYRGKFEDAPSIKSYKR